MRIIRLNLIMNQCRNSVMTKTILITSIVEATINERVWLLFIDINRICTSAQLRFQKVLKGILINQSMTILILKANLLWKLSRLLNKTDKKFTLDDFVVLSLLGYGTFGCVLLVKHIKTEEAYAVKVIKKSSINIKNKQIEHIKHEKDVLSLIKNFEFKFYTTLTETLQDNYWLYFFLDFIQGGELHTFIKRKLVIPIEGIKFYMAEVVWALEQLHKNGIGNNYIYWNYKL